MKKKKNIHSPPRGVRRLSRVGYSRVDGGLSGCYLAPDRAVSSRSPVPCLTGAERPPLSADPAPDPPSDLCLHSGWLRRPPALPPVRQAPRGDSGRTDLHDELTTLHPYGRNSLHGAVSRKLQPQAHSSAHAPDRYTSPRRDPRDLPSFPSSSPYLTQISSRRTIYRELEVPRMDQRRYRTDRRRDLGDRDPIPVKIPRKESL